MQILRNEKAKVITERLMPLSHLAKMEDELNVLRKAIRLAALEGIALCGDVYRSIGFADYFMVWNYDFGTDLSKSEIQWVQNLIKSTAARTAHTVDYAPNALGLCKTSAPLSFYLRSG